MKRKLILIVTHAIAVVLGGAIVTGVQSVRLREQRPASWSGPPSDLGESVVLASCERFVLMGAKFHDPANETSYFLWDRTTDEALASFSGDIKGKPLLSRTLYVPGRFPYAVACVNFDKLDSSLLRVVLSPVSSGQHERRLREQIFDDNCDGVCDRILQGDQSPYRALVRMSDIQWAEVRAVAGTDGKDTGDGEVLLDGEWVRARQADDGFWHPVAD